MKRKHLQILFIFVLVLIITGCGTRQNKTTGSKTPQTTTKEMTPQAENHESASMPSVTWQGKVVSVHDGDTIKVMREERPVKIRLNGIDAPELRQDFGTQSKKTLSRLVFGKVVGVRAVDIDRYGRTVGIIYLPDGTNVNYAMVRSGMAWWYRQYAPDDTTLAEYEQEAREAKRGLWSRGDAVAPWEYRRHRRSSRK